MIRMSLRICLIAFSVTLLAASGCQKADSARAKEVADSSAGSSSHDDHKDHDHHSDEHAGETGGHHDDHDHEHEDHEHLEHFVPPHKPAGFDELVSQLFLRCETLPKLADADAAEFQKRSAEMRDILNWIPELAADSNLKRKGFETAVAERERLLKSFDASQGGRTLRMTDVQESLERLKALVPDSIEVAPNVPVTSEQQPVNEGQSPGTLNQAP